MRSVPPLPRRPGPRAERRRPPREDAGLRPAETRCPVPWSQRGGPPRPPPQGARAQRAAARVVQKSKKDAPRPPPNCHRGTKVRKKCTTPPRAGADPTRGACRRGARPPHAADTLRHLPASWRPPRGARRLRARAGHPGNTSRNVLKIDQNVFPGRKTTAVVLKIGQSVFLGRGLQTPGARARVAGARMPSEKPQVGRRVSFSRSARPCEAGPGDAAAGPKSLRPETHSARFSAQRPLSGCRKTHFGRFSAHDPIDSGVPKWRRRSPDLGADFRCAAAGGAHLCRM